MGVGNTCGVSVEKTTNVEVIIPVSGTNEGGTDRHYNSVVF